MISQPSAPSGRAKAARQAPIVRGRKGIYRKELEDAARQGFVRARVDGEVRDLADEIELDKQKKHTIEIVVDRLIIRPDLKNRLTENANQIASLERRIADLSGQIAQLNEEKTKAIAEKEQAMARMQKEQRLP